MPTLTYALLGWPLGGGLSAAMHNAAFQSLGIDARYQDRPTPTGDLAAAVAELRGGFLAGANVTTPHKLAIRPLLDDEGDEVTRLGAVNTVAWTPGGLVGYNTDIQGFAKALAAFEDDAEGEFATGAAGQAMTDGPTRSPAPGLGREAVILGAGGAARAAGHVLLAQGYTLRILARSAGQSGTLAALLYRLHPGAVLSSGPLEPATLGQAAERADLLVNATPLGGPTAASASPWPADLPLPGHMTVLDLVAWPTETILVRQARATGCRAAGGATMLLHQAAAAFELWTGRPAPLDLMRAALADAYRDH